MEKGLRMWVKTILIIAGLMLFCFLAGRRGTEMDPEKEARIKQYEEDENVEKIETVLLAWGELFLQENEGEKKVFTTSGIYTYETEEVESALYRQVTAYVRDNMILDIVIDKNQSKVKLSNVWVGETEDDRILCFFDGNYFYLPVLVEKENREQVADIYLKNGMIEECSFKKEKISGKLLRVSEDKILLGEKEWKLTEDMRVYRLYGTLEEVTLQDLRIGYQNADYVIENGKICACLITSEENMEAIRVLIKSGNYTGNYHENVLISADCDYMLQYGENRENYKAGEQINIKSDSGYYNNSDRILLTPAVNTGKIELQSIQRSREITDYRGTLEIIKTEEGLVVINEVLLEEYLYGVVPSEMPASYPLESLKAQAVCARTYAYGNMEKAGLPELGAHVDDSTAFQVYGNIEERAETTAAVKETKGQVLTYQDSPINAYYYSTSCGVGTDLKAWNGMDAETLPYLQVKTVKPTVGALTEMEDGKENAFPPEALCDEDTFTEFIKNEQNDFPESKEAWFRWRYEVSEIDVEEMEQRILDRYAVQPGFILIKEENDYISQQPKGIGDLLNLKIVKRNTGGNAAELMIEGTKGTYLIQTEYNIRYVLNNGDYQVLRADGSEVNSPTLLPSAFISMETYADDGIVTGYVLYGGGYGHGIGMSQNGAKNMALEGMSSEEILDFFYEESEMELIY